MQTLATTRPKSPFRGWIFRLVYIALIIAGTAGYFSLNEASAELDRKNEAIAKTPTITGKVQIGDASVVIPLDALFAEGSMWSLTSKKHPLPSSFTVESLVDSPVATGGGEKIQIAKAIASPLEALIDTAETEGYELMVSSAYRSIEEQQKTYDTFVARYGKDMAQEYVSPPGSSEHHTGLAVDLSDSSPACTEDSEKCSLGMESAEWLVTNAPRYGFVLRYPEGKRDITGVGYEWWHFRYVGVPLAKALATSDLTLDEAIEKMRATR